MSAGLWLAATLLAWSGAPETARCYPPPVPDVIALAYSQPTCPYCPGQRGVEYELAVDTVVRVVARGVVTFAGVVAGTRYVVVLQADGLRATYGILQTSSVNRGDVVREGQTVGLSGSRLYFGLRDATGAPLDPTPLLGSLVGRARLLPPDGSGQRPAPRPRLACMATVSRGFAV